MTQLKIPTQPVDMDSIFTPWKQPRQKRYLLTGARLINVIDGSIHENTTIRLEDGFITEVRPGSDADAQSPLADSKVVRIELNGKYVVPGLTDCHVHLKSVPGASDLFGTKAITPDVSLLRQPFLVKTILDRGFTTLRDCGGASLELKLAIEEGVHPGPRLFIANHALSQTGGHGDSRQPLDKDACCTGDSANLSRLVDGVPECLKSAREEIRTGADFIKIMGGGGVASQVDKIGHVQFSPEEIKAIVTVAKNAGTYVTSHAYTPAAVQQAISQGVRGIEHGNLIDEETAKTMAEKDCFLTPTLVTYATMLRPEFKHFLPPSSLEKNRQVYKQGLRSLKLATDAGVNIVFGSDLLGPLHFAQADEFALRAQVQTPLQILQSATVTAAKLLYREKIQGQVAPGFVADLLILNANPLEDITVFSRPDQHLLAVIKDGRVVTSRWSQVQVDRLRNNIIQ